MVKWDPARSAGPTQRGGARHLNHKRNMVERAEPHTGHEAFGAMKHNEERNKPQPRFKQAGNHLRMLT